MRGKKKIKWRKLPLEEFTNDCPKAKQTRSSNETKSDFVRKEETAQNIPYQDITEEYSQPFNNEYVENADGLWYPTPCLVYNPVPVYPPNYIMPTDANCYYYPLNEMNPVPDYTEYMPPLKDTVYLVFPASALRSTQYSPYDWRNRRRRRRYNGYAEYAVIPEKNNIDDKPNEKNGTSSTLAKSIVNQFENVIVNPGDSGIKVLNTTQDIQSIDRKSEDRCSSINKMGLSKSENNEECRSKQKKVIDVCDVHSKVSKQDSQSSLNKIVTTNDRNLQNSSSGDNSETNNMKDESKEMSISELNSSKKSDEESIEQMTEKQVQNRYENVNSIKNATEICDATRKDPNNTLSDDLPSSEMFYLVKEKNEMNAYEKSTSFQQSNKKCISDITSSDALLDENQISQSTLPDIINTVNKTTIPPLDENIDNSSLNNYRIQSCIHNTKNINECVSKIPSVSATRSAYLPYLFNNDSDVLNSVNKITDANMPKIKPLCIKNSIYKLAFDESHSDTESRSPSPIERKINTGIEQYRVQQQPIDIYALDYGPNDPIHQIPSSLMSDEINVFEADSDDDAGSEDLDMNPHPYTDRRHIYENKLSLAVELLRTRESLPYDAQFKRIVEDSEEYENKAFVDDSLELDSNNFSLRKSDHKAITNQCKTNQGISENSYELADEAVAQSANYQEYKEEANIGYRRMGVQFRHYFSPSSTLNPWNCCNIM